MDRTEIICISSDDEDLTKQSTVECKEYSITKSFLHDSKEVKTEILFNEEKKAETSGQKRKAGEIEKNITNGMEKKRKCSPNRKESDQILNDAYNDSEKVDDISEQTDLTMKLVQKPKLIVKEKRSISQMEQDIFPMFISLCLQRDRSDDMKTIVNKLKRRYEQLDSTYAQSEAFIEFLNEKRNDIMNSTCKLYVYIEEVMNEMKNSCKGKSQLLLHNQNREMGQSHLKILDLDSSAECNSENENTMKHTSTKRKIIKIQNAMAKCQKYIKWLEETEVDFGKEKNSNYIKLERYKLRMVELYNAYCKYSGENVDAGRPYLRPKHLTLSGMTAVDQAITSFINSKISKRNNIKKVGAFVDAIIFPDYRDILQCVTRCNNLHNLGLTIKKQQQIAKKAFSQLGEYLQRMRRRDYFDTFSLYLENKEEDPAVKDPILAEKLMENRREGEKRLANVFQEYVKKQEEMKEDCPEDKTTSEIDDDEESGREDEDKTVEDDTNFNNGDEDFNIKNIEIDKNTQEEKIIRDMHSTIKSTSNVHPEPNEKKSTTCTDVIEIHEDTETQNAMTCAESRLNHSNVTQTNILGDVDTLSCTDNLKTSEESDTKSIDRTTTSCIKRLTNAITTSTVEYTNYSDKPEENVSKVVAEETERDELLKEEKPLLRVRSFAKPPTTWEDGRQKGDNPILDADKVKVVTKDIVRNVMCKTPKEAPVITKCTSVKIGSKIFPVVNGKYKTFLIPRNKSIIRAKNITNNCKTLIAQNVNSNTLPKVQTTSVLSSLDQVLGANGESAIIHVPTSTIEEQINTNGTLQNTKVKLDRSLTPIFKTKSSVCIPIKQTDTENALKTTLASSTMT